MNDVQIKTLIEQYAGLVKRCAREVWRRYGSPAGIQPTDLHNAGYRGLLDSAEEWEADPELRQLLFPLVARASVRVRSRIEDELRGLQVGAVTYKKVELPGGGTGRFT